MERKQSLLQNYTRVFQNSSAFTRLTHFLYQNCWSLNSFFRFNFDGYLPKRNNIFGKVEISLSRLLYKIPRKYLNTELENRRADVINEKQWVQNEHISNENSFWRTKKLSSKKQVTSLIFPRNTWFYIYTLKKLFLTLFQIFELSLKVLLSCKYS